MIIPIRTDRPPRRQPVVTQTLIALNVLIYVVGLVGRGAGAFDAEALATLGQFDPQNFRVWQLLTSMFIHDPHAIWHLAFNMLFLWVFGAPVEDRLGRVGYLVFYVTGGVVAGLAHMAVSSAPVIGASGSIAALTGAFLALFPRSHIVVLFLLTLSAISIPSLWFIGLYFAIDVLRQTGELLGDYGSGVAYMAHIAGYVYGFVVAFALLGLRIVKREEYDVFFLFTQARRRAAFRAASRSHAAGLWDTAQADTGRRLAERNRKVAVLSEYDQRLAEQRAEINRLALAHDLPGAAAIYRDLLREAPDCVFSEQRQLELANQLCADQEPAAAAPAYELLLESYPNCAKAAEVRLMLALLYARQLNQPQRAREVIELARPAIQDPSQTALLDQLLGELKEPTAS